MMTLVYIYLISVLASIIIFITMAKTGKRPETPFTMNMFLVFAPVLNTLFALTCIVVTLVILVGALLGKNWEV